MPSNEGTLYSAFGFLRNYPLFRFALDPAEEEPEATTAEAQAEEEKVVNDGNPLEAGTEVAAQLQESRAGSAHGLNEAKGAVDDPTSAGDDPTSAVVAKDVSALDTSLTAQEQQAVDIILRALGLDPKPTIDMVDMGLIDGLYDPLRDYNHSAPIGGMYPYEQPADDPVPSVDAPAASTISYPGNAGPSIYQPPSVPSNGSSTPSPSSPVDRLHLSSEHAEEVDSIVNTSKAPSSISSASSANSGRPSEVRSSGKGKAHEVHTENTPPSSTHAPPSESSRARQINRYDYSDGQASSSRITIDASRQSSVRERKASNSRQFEATEEASLTVSSSTSKSALSDQAVNTLSQAPTASEEDYEPTERERSPTLSVTPVATKEKDSLPESNEVRVDQNGEPEPEEFQASSSAPALADRLFSCNWQGTCRHEIVYTDDMNKGIVDLRKHLKETHFQAPRQSTVVGNGVQVANVQATLNRFHCGHPGCEQSYTHLCDLARHYFYKHFDLKVDCHVCGGTFARRDSLRRHDPGSTICKTIKKNKEEAALNGERAPRGSRANKRKADDEDEWIPPPSPKRQRARQ